VLSRGRYTTFDPDDNALTLPLGINDRGQVVGVYINPDAAPTLQPTGTPPRGRRGAPSGTRRAR
jgi:hypothetical protein